MGAYISVPIINKRLIIATTVSDRYACYLKRKTKDEEGLDVTFEEREKNIRPPLYY